MQFGAFRTAYKNIIQQQLYFKQLQRMNTPSGQIFVANSINTQPSTTALGPLEMSQGAVPMDIQNIRDFSNVCRTCAAVSEYVIPIFEGEGLINNLAVKIRKHLPIQVSEYDALPHVVCYQCASTLLAWHELVSCCVQADAALRTRMPMMNASQQNPGPIKVKNRLDTSKNRQEQFRDTSSLGARPRDPPRYSESTTRHGITAPTKICGYCKTEVAESVYNSHLSKAHGHLVFCCDECNNYVDRNTFLNHMSDHATVISNSHHHAANSPGKKIIKAFISLDLNQYTKLPPKYSAPTTRSRIMIKKINTTPNEPLDQSDTSRESGSDSQSQPSDEVKDRPAESEPAVETQVNKKKQNKKRAANQTKPKWSRSCPVCSKNYTASSSFFYHLKHSHATSKEHECDVCGKKFVSKANLIQHGATHTDEPKFACTACEKRFKSRASLYIHSQTHQSGAGRHACGTCGRAFRWRAALARHVARHAGARPHACAACPRAFSVRADLVRHARTHGAAGRARHPCHLCGHKFAQQRYLNVHLANKHALKPNKQSNKTNARKNNKTT